MSYLTQDEHKAIIANPAAIEDIYVRRWRTFADDMQPLDTGLILGGAILPVAFAAMVAWDLKPYGIEPSSIKLEDLLAAPSLACDQYVRLTWYLTSYMPQITWVPVKIAAIGWNAGAVGNHAQMLVSDGTNSLLLDPTTGFAAKDVSFDTLLQGKPVPWTNTASFEKYNPYPGSFTQTVKQAVMNGLYKPHDLLYYVGHFDTFLHMPAISSWLTPQAAALTPIPAG